MSKFSSGYEKFLNRVIALFAIFLYSCSDLDTHKFQSHYDDSHQQILNGEAVMANDLLSKRALYLATGALLIKTPEGGYKASAQGQCTATAIKPNVILTAAHCIKGLTPADDASAEELYIILGIKPWKTALEPSLWYDVESIEVHPEYKHEVGKPAENDLALLKLKRPLPLDYVTPLATGSMTNSEMILTMAGYGQRSNQKNVAGEQLKDFSGELYKLVKKIKAFDIQSDAFRVDQTDFKGICFGDSGGPGLVYDPKTKTYSLLGVVSGFNWIEQDKQIKDPKDEYTCYGEAMYMNLLYSKNQQWLQEFVQKWKL